MPMQTGRAPEYCASGFAHEKTPPAGRQLTGFRGVARLAARGGPYSWRTHTCERPSIGTPM